MPCKKTRSKKPRLKRLICRKCNRAKGDSLKDFLWQREG